MHDSSKNLADRDGAPLPSPMGLLMSGGLDCAILLGELLAQGIEVAPLYVRCGLRWEKDELRHLRRLLAALEFGATGVPPVLSRSGTGKLPVSHNSVPGAHNTGTPMPPLRPLEVLEMPVGDLYRDHWSLSGPDVPDERSRDEAVFLPGRNVLLLTKGMLWCHLRGVPAVAIATLRGNPFPDATPDFVANLARVVNQAVSGEVKIQCPYSKLSKRDVLGRCNGVPLELTMSCLSPRDGIHCGQCNKCAERKLAFAQAGIVDPTSYTEATARQ